MGSQRARNIREAQRIVAEGGQGTEVVLLAKKSAAEAAAADGCIVGLAPLLSQCFDESAAKVRTAMGTAIEGINGLPDFVVFAQASERRAQLYLKIAGMLKDPAPAPTMNAAEEVAIPIVQTKVGCKSAVDTIVDSFQGGVRYVPIQRPADEQKIQRPVDEQKNTSLQALEILEGLQAKAQTGL